MKFALKAEAGKKRRKKKPCWFLEDGISGKQYSITSQALSNLSPGTVVSSEQSGRNICSEFYPDHSA